MIVPCRLLARYLHDCGGWAVQLAEGDPILVFDVDRDDPRMDPTSYPIVWRERYACTWCGELIEIKEPLRVMRHQRRRSGAQAPLRHAA